MKKNISNFFGKIYRFIKTKKGIALVSIIIILLVVVFASGKNSDTYQFVDVEKGPITETVSVTGNTSPVQSVLLGFGSTGNVSRIYSSIGKQVTKGQLLASLDSSDLYAQSKQAEANLGTQKAKLAGLVSGSRPEDIAASQAALDKAKQDLVNLYATASDISNDSYSKANDAVRVQLDELFFDDETTSPKLTYSTDFPVDTITSGRALASKALNEWSAENNESRLVIIKTFITDTMKSLDKTLNLSASTVASYKASATISLNSVNTAIKNINTLNQNIASQKLTISQLQSQLDLKKAGTSQADILAQEAQVKSAEAGLESIYAKLENTRIIAPINGVVTQFDAKVGQLATAGTPLISIISDSSFEINALVSEIDIGKINVGDKVNMTLDAFASEIFTGTVFYVDPAETTSEGVVGYNIKISFDENDPRLKSGLTCNIDITTNYKENVLILPQYAIIQDDDGIFVQVLKNEKTEKIPVTLGIRDKDGKVEILTGVSEGEKVINIGLKQK